MKLPVNAKDTELLDWEQMETLVHLVASGTMKRADAEIGGMDVKVYHAGVVLRIDIQVKDF